MALNDQMKAVRKRNETSVIDQIGEDLLSWVNSIFILENVFQKVTYGVRG